MKILSVSELKTHLSKNLRLIKSGERLLITERGKPVAEVGPPPVPEDLALRRLYEAGLLRLGRQKLSADFWNRSRPTDPSDSVRRAILEEREEGR